MRGRGEAGKLVRLVERVAGMAVVLVTRRWRVWGVKRDTEEPKSRHRPLSELLLVDYNNTWCVCVCVCIWGEEKERRVLGFEWLLSTVH